MTSIATSTNAASSALFRAVLRWSGASIRCLGASIPDPAHETIRMAWGSQVDTACAMPHFRRHDKPGDVNATHENRGCAGQRPSPRTASA